MEDVDTINGIQNEKFADLDQENNDEDGIDDNKDLEVAIIAFWNLIDSSFKC